MRSLKNAGVLGVIVLAAACGEPSDTPGPDGSSDDGGAQDGAAEANTDGTIADVATDVGCVPSCNADADGDGIPDGVEGRCSAVDTDKDGTPDYLDLDSDGDLVLDSVEWKGGCDPKAAANDPDGDSIPSFQDLDSDGDAVNDRCEARAHASPLPSELNLAVLDSDTDGKPDFLDGDSDGDLIADGAEDKNGNCAIDVNETDRLKADTDGDGINDFVEVTLSGVAVAVDPTQTPIKQGKFYFVEPYSANGTLPPQPNTARIALGTQVRQADVGIVIDTTGSMGGPISGLKTQLSALLTSLASKVPDVAIGIARHDDFPVAPYGALTDVAFGVATTMTTNLVTAQTAANSLAIDGGGDGPENQAAALLRALHGDALTWTSGSLAVVPPTSTAHGALLFRNTAYPFLVSITDADFHGGLRALDTTGTSYDATPQSPYSGFSAPGSAALVTEVVSAGATVLGISVDGGGRLAGGSGGNPYVYQAYVADKTSSLVPSAAFGGGGCATGVGGAKIPVDGPGGLCRLVFSIPTNGSGLGPAIDAGVGAALATVPFNIYPLAIPAVSNVDSVDAFVNNVAPDPAGGTDPVTGQVCVTFASVKLSDFFHTPKALPGAGDVKETIATTPAGSVYCFNVVPKPNTTVPATNVAQVYSATIGSRGVRGSATLPLGPADRSVTFIVPPIPPTP